MNFSQEHLLSNQLQTRGFPFLILNPQTSCFVDVSLFFASLLAASKLKTAVFEKKECIELMLRKYCSCESFEKT